MYVANKGKTAPKMERRKVLAAIAEAALYEKLLVFDCFEGGAQLRMKKTYNMR